MGELTRRSLFVLAGAAGTVALTGRAAYAASGNGPLLMDAGVSALEVHASGRVVPRDDLSGGGGHTVSRDGRHIAFHQPVVHNGPHGLHLADRVTGEIRPITDNGALVGGGWPSFSPDGTQLVVSRADDLYIVDLATGHSTPLHVGGGATYPAWSPDGSRIAFTTSVGGGNYAIRVIKLATGRTTTPLPSSKDARYPTWTPDSKKILFTTSDYAQPVPDRWLPADIAVMFRDGTDVTRLTTQSTYYLSPTFSPDGTRVAVLATPQPTEEEPEPDGYTVQVFRAGDFTQNKWIRTYLYEDAVRLSWMRELPA